MSLEILKLEDGSSFTVDSLGNYAGVEGVKEGAAFSVYDCVTLKRVFHDYDATRMNDDPILFVGSLLEKLGNGAQSHLLGLALVEVLRLKPDLAERLLEWREQIPKALPAEVAA